MTNPNQEFKIMPDNKAPLSDDDSDDISMWVVYEDMPEFPNQYVARRQRLDIDTGEYVLGNSLKEVRAKLPAGLIRVERSEHDLPQIRESWF
jgi:hypothetical protein